MKKFITIIFSISIFFTLQAQDDGFYGPSEEEKEASKKELRQKKLERWSFGGNFWLSLGSSAYVEASPLVMYRTTPRIGIGGGFTYIFYKYNSIYTSPYQSSVYGPRAMINYTLFANLHEKLNVSIGNIILQAEYERLNVDEIDYNYSLTGDRVWVNNLLLGGGIFQPFGARGGLSLVILYNIVENNNSAYTYSNPIFRIGFYF
jgi:hypothetical protein